MEEKIIKLLEPYFANNPGSFIVLLGLILGIRHLRKYIDEHIKEVRGWLCRHDKEFEKRDQKFDELIKTTQEGLKDERKYQQEIHLENSKKIDELTKEIYYMKGKNNGKQKD